MASTHIEISASASRTSGQTRYAIDKLQQVVDEFDKLKAVFDQAAMGGDWAALGGLLGVSDIEAEQIYNIWGSATTELKGTFISQLLSRCG